MSKVSKQTIRTITSTEYPGSIVEKINRSQSTTIKRLKEHTKIVLIKSIVAQRGIVKT